MSQRKATAISKFGHLFGDSSDTSSTSNRSSRLSASGDLYRDPLAALIPPVTATTTTTKSAASSVKATLSPPPPTSPTSTTSRSSPPGSTSTSRSSSRLQHNALFSSLTQQDSSGSLFDTPSAPSSSLSSVKRELLFGEAGSTSVSRRTSTPPLSRVTSGSPSISSQQSSRVPTPPLGGGVRVGTAGATTILDPNASPLGGNTKPSTGDEDSDVLSTKSWVGPLTRTSSRASTKSRDSTSTASLQSDDVAVEDTPFTGVKQSTARSMTAAVEPLATASSPPSLQQQPSSKSNASRKNSHVQPKPAPATTNSMVANPLSQGPLSDKPAMDWTPSPTSQSIETFQSISRSSSPSVVSTTTRAPAASNYTAERESRTEAVSPTPSSSSATIPIQVVIPDDAAVAFADGLDFSGSGRAFLTNLPSQIASPALSSMGSFLDSVGPLSGSVSASTTVKTSTTGHLKTGSGFSLGEDVSDAANPWMNSLVDSLESTNLTTNTTAVQVVDYTQSDPSGSSGGFLPEIAFTTTTSSITSTTSPPTTSKSSSLFSTKTSTTTARMDTQLSNTLSTMSMEAEMGGFDEIFSAGSRKPYGGASSIKGPGLGLAGPPMNQSIAYTMTSGSTLTKQWNILDAVEAASMDPDFLGPTSAANQATDKVLAMMQMPKDDLDKDVSAQEVFDNPWE